jgi:hypothetical protein
MSAFLHSVRFCSPASLHPSRLPDHCIMRTSATTLTARFYLVAADVAIRSQHTHNLYLMHEWLDQFLHACTRPSNLRGQHGDGHTAARHSLHATGSRSGKQYYWLAFSDMMCLGIGGSQADAIAP